MCRRGAPGTRTFFFFGGRWLLDKRAHHREEREVRSAREPECSTALPSTLISIAGLVGLAGRAAQVTVVHVKEHGVFAFGADESGDCLTNAAGGDQGSARHTSEKNTEASEVPNMLTLLITGAPMVAALKRAVLPITVQDMNPPLGWRADELALQVLLPRFVQASAYDMETLEVRLAPHSSPSNESELAFRVAGVPPQLGPRGDEAGGGPDW